MKLLQSNLVILICLPRSFQIINRNLSLPIRRIVLFDETTFYIICSYAQIEIYLLKMPFDGKNLTSYFIPSINQ